MGIFLWQADLFLFILCIFQDLLTVWGGGARKSHTAGSGESHPGELEKEKKL